jgi:hypothetical protein
MKKILLSALTLVSSFALIAQQVTDTVYIGESYADQSYYSLSNDEVANISNLDWDLAFETAVFGVSIRINGQMGTELYKYPNGDTSDWASIDTTGLSTWEQYHNSDNYWEYGAFNEGADTSDFFDYGWGNYNPFTHIVVGDSLYILKLSNGDFKKIWIVYMNPNQGINEYNFKYADIDGENEVEVTIEKDLYATKNFSYYSIQNEEQLDREPDSDTWDIVFTKYIAILEGGTPYPVTGGLTNEQVWSAQADDVDIASASWSDYLFSDTISIIGSDWKSFDLTTFSWVLAEDRCYFVQDVDENIWKIVFTGFGGSSTGLIEFTKEQVGTVGVNEVDNSTEFVLYPNPSTDGNVNIRFNNTSSSILTTIVDLSGKQVFAEQYFNQGEQIQQIDVSSFAKGLYIISIENDRSKISKKLIIK